MRFAKTNPFKQFFKFVKKVIIKYKKKNLLIKSFYILI
ncbi:hypothetical protein M33023_05340 [Candidatus Phytoplasma asteris]|uniref:Uncharacterized protein n=1 Tax=Candidatus Phytoplasma asteris TaxID=85620 RepID=A0ABZ2YGI4_9MOLU